MAPKVLLLWPWYVGNHYYTSHQVILKEYFPHILLVLLVSQPSMGERLSILIGSSDRGMLAKMSHPNLTFVLSGHFPFPCPIRRSSLVLSSARSNEHRGQ